MSVNSWGYGLPFVSKMILLFKVFFCFVYIYWCLVTIRVTQNVTALILSERHYLQSAVGIRGWVGGLLFAHALISVSLLQSGTGQPSPPSLTLGLKLSMWRCRKSCQRNFTTPGVLIVKVQLGTFNQFLLQLYWRWCLYLLRMWITLWTGITLKTGITSTRTNTESQNLLPSRSYQRVGIRKVSICFKRNEWSITVNCKVKVSWIIPL